MGFHANGNSFFDGEFSRIEIMPGILGEDEEGSGDFDYSEFFEEVDTDEDGFVSAIEMFSYEEILSPSDFDDEEEKEQYAIWAIGLLQNDIEEEGCDEDGDELLNVEEFVNYWTWNCPFSPEPEVVTSRVHQRIQQTKTNWNRHQHGPNKIDAAKLANLRKDLPSL